MTRPGIGRADICAVVVTYFPPPDFPENLQALASQVSAILLIDNASAEASYCRITAVAAKLGVTVRRNPVNEGIAAALNTALSFAREHGYEWIATFDQDSLASPDMMERMVELLGSYEDTARLALITPVHKARHLGVSYSGSHCLARGSNWRRLAIAMTSGNLVNVNTAISLGGFDSGFFIDYVDNDFCLRLRRNGYHVVEASTAVLWHSLGTTTVHRFLWKRLRTTNHPPTRRYYITRNRLISWKRHWRFDARWALWDMKKFLQSCAYILLFEEQKSAKLVAVAHGLWDGVRNVHGPMKLGSPGAADAKTMEPAE